MHYTRIFTVILDCRAQFMPVRCPFCWGKLRQGQCAPPQKFGDVPCSGQRVARRYSHPSKLYSAAITFACSSSVRSL
jgi:hypothetical protein